MMCPVCANVELKMTERQGVEVDYCSKCRGVWLDRGELDKIIELSAGQRSPERDRQAESTRESRDSRSDRDDRDDRGDRDDMNRNPRRRKSLLGDLFDF